jgi:diguanylate cyclase (GGDEF)-like protein
MDYGTLFFSNIATVTVFTVCITLLAWKNPRIVGMKWFAGGLIVGLIKLVLQGMEGEVPPFISSMLMSQLYLVSFTMQLMGLHWFVVRKPVRHRWPFIAIGIALVVYAVMFLCSIPYSTNVINIPAVIVCGVSGWIVLKYGRGPFTAVSRVAGIILFAEMITTAYRAVLTNIRYAQPWMLFRVKNDPAWLYSLAAMAFLATFMVMCDLWFLVTELQRELAELARTDPLTGALNRRALEEAALRETARSIRYGHLLCMVILDIDHFKKLNDTRGHAAGDCALQALVNQTKLLLREQDLLARTGGEEFTIMLPNTPVSAGIAVAERIRQAIEELEVHFAGEPIKFTVSLGVAEFDPRHGNWESMMQRADIAMYEAKEHGRNTVAADGSAI